jgi:hypothetical protein
MLYVGLDDRLHVRIFPVLLLPPVPLLVVRILKVDGSISVQEERLAGLVLATMNTFAFSLPEGFILNVSITGGPGGTVRGTVYTLIDIIRGAGKDGTQSHKLTSGYLSGLNPVCWPEALPDPPALGRGALTVLPITAAAGAEFVVSTPIGARGRLMSIYAVLVTSAVVATRQALFTLGLGPVFVVPAPSTQAASLTQYYSGGPAVSYQVALLNRCTFPTPVDFWVGGGSALVTSSTGGISAGDQWSGNVLAELTVDN